MSHNHELENQDLHPTTVQSNLPGEELPEQDLDAVSGGVAVLGLTDELEDIGDESNSPVDENINGLAGDMLDLNKGLNNVF